MVYTDNYLYHTKISDAERSILEPYKVTPALMGLANHNAAFMHPLPATRGNEVTAEVIDGKNSLVLTQGENRMHVIKAVLALLVK